MTRFLPLAAIALALASPVGCGEQAEPGGEAPSAAETRRALAGSPQPLARIHEQANELLEGGREAFEARLRRLRGHPVVVNKWASWCHPCREELPYFQRQALKHGSRVAFLGVDSNDAQSEARRFLERFPVSYPSYADPDLEVAAAFNAVQAFPATAFYDSKGALAYLKQGGYPSERALAADIRRYAR